MTAAVRFEAPIAVDESIPEGYMRHYIAFPETMAPRFVDVKRVSGTIDGTPFSRVPFIGSNGAVRIRFGMAWLRDAGLVPGDVVEVEVGEDPDPDRVDVPLELSARLDADPVAEALWEDLSPGRKRTLVFGIERAKKAETRERRAQTIFGDLRQAAGLDREP